MSDQKEAPQLSEPPKTLRLLSGLNCHHGQGQEKADEHVKARKFKEGLNSASDFITTYHSRK